MCIIFTLESHVAKRLEDILAKHLCKMVCSERHTGKITNTLQIVNIGAVPRDMHNASYN